MILALLVVPSSLQMLIRPNNEGETNNNVNGICLLFTSEVQSCRKLYISWHQSPDDLGFYKSYHIPIKYFCNAVSLHALERLLKSFTDLNLKFETVQSSTLCFETHIFGSRTFSSSFLSALSCDRPHCRTCSHFIKATWMCLMGRRHRG